jgi:hypothetical protein
MKITFESNLLIPAVSKAFSILTDGAKVCLDDIHYDEAKGIVDIYMQRQIIKGFKRSFWGVMQPVYGQTMIKSLLTIRQVEEMNIKVHDSLETYFNSCFTLMFGVKVDDNEMYLGSLQEAQGTVLCQIYIKVKEISIEFVDEVNE